MYSHGYNWREEPEGTAVSSVLLLLVFVAAAAFLVGMMVLTPWDNGSPAAPAEVQAPAPPPAEGGQPAAEGAPAPAEGAPAPAVEQPAPGQ